MENATYARASVFGLIRALTRDTRKLLRQEVQLARTEFSEKIARMGHNTAALAVGGFVAYAGLIVFLLGLGWLLAWAFSTAGMAPLLAAFLGLTVIGLVVTAIGCVLLLKGIRALSQESLTPQRTLYTLHELKGTSAVAQARTAAKPSSQEIQTHVEATEGRMGETLDELGYRLSPQHINAEVKQRIQENPYRAGLYAVLAGVVSGLLLRRKLHHA